MEDGGLRSGGRGGSDSSLLPNCAGAVFVLVPTSVSPLSSLAEHATGPGVVGGAVRSGLGLATVSCPCLCVEGSLLEHAVTGSCLTPFLSATPS